MHGYKVFICDSEEQARKFFDQKRGNGIWPVYISKGDTTGEKLIEEFHTDLDLLDLDRFSEVGIVKSRYIDRSWELDYFFAENGKNNREKKLESK